MNLLKKWEEEKDLVLSEGMYYVTNTRPLEMAWNPRVEEDGFKKVGRGQQLEEKQEKQLEELLNRHSSFL